MPPKKGAKKGAAKGKAVAARQESPQVRSCDLAF
jgi:hypothetical protein